MQTAGSEERTHVDARMMRRWSDGLAAQRDGEGDGEKPSCSMVVLGQFWTDCSQSLTHAARINDDSWI